MQITSAYLQATSTNYGWVRKNKLTAEQRNLSNWTTTGNLVVEYDAERNLNTVTIPQEVGQYLAPDGRYYKYYYYSKIRNMTYCDEVKAYSNKPFARDQNSGSKCWMYWVGQGSYNLREVFAASHANVHYFGEDVWVGAYKNGALLDDVLSWEFWGSPQYWYETNVPEVVPATPTNLWNITNYLIGLETKKFDLVLEWVAESGKDYTFEIKACTTTGAEYMVGELNRAMRMDDGAMSTYTNTWTLTQSTTLSDYVLTMTNAQSYRTYLTIQFTGLRNSARNLVFEIKDIGFYEVMED